MKTSLKILLPFLVVLTFGFGARAQQADTTQTKPLNKKAIYGSARKAAVMSACLPGLGQVYNRKYWKVPIIYAALGGLTYGFIFNNNEYTFYKDQLHYMNNDTTKLSTSYTSDQLVSLKNSYRRNRDLCIIGGVVVYVLNIIDANVDAHLRTFDVSDDLSLRIKPYTNLSLLNPMGNSIQTGLTLQLKFK